MKKLLFAFVVLLVSLTSSFSLELRSTSFLAVNSLIVSNATGGWTNLSSTYCLDKTNSAYLRWTNRSGIKVDGTNTSYYTTPLMFDLPLTAPVSIFSPVYAGSTVTYSSTNAWVADTLQAGPWIGKLSVTVGAGNASAVGTVTFIPLPDMENEVTDVTQAVTLTITPSTTVDRTFTTNLNANVFAFSKGIRCLSYGVAAGANYTNLIKEINLIQPSP